VGIILIKIISNKKQHKIIGKEHESGKGFCLNVSTLAIGCGDQAKEDLIVSTLAHGRGDKANEQFKGIENI